jgi:hypothetical protein
MTSDVNKKVRAPGDVVASLVRSTVRSTRLQKEVLLLGHGFDSALQRRSFAAARTGTVRDTASSTRYC